MLFSNGIELLEPLWMGISRAARASRYEQHRTGRTRHKSLSVDAALVVEMKMTRVDAHQDFGTEADPPVELYYNMILAKSAVT